MTAALFEAFDDTGRLQMTSEATKFYVSNTFSVTTTNVANSFGRAIISVSDSSDLVAFRCTDGFNISGYRGFNDYTFITQTLVCNIDVKILSLMSTLSPSIDSLGLQLFAPNSALQYSSGRGMAFFLDSTSVYGEDDIGDVGDNMTFPNGTNPYAVIGGNQLIAYTGDSGTDTYERIINVGTMTSNTINIASVTRNDWPGMPSTSGVEAKGNYIVLAVT